MPLTRLNTVVLPAPLGPITLTISRSPATRSRPSRTFRPPNDRDRPCSSSTGASAISDHLHAPLAEQAVRSRVHQDDEERAEQELARDRRLVDEPQLPHHRAEHDEGR